MPKVLVVDDSPVIYKMIKRALEPLGFELVGHAVNGRAGLDLYELYQPDLVTLDVTMPIMNGLEMARELLGKHPEAVVIMLSSMDDQDLLASAREIGLRFFLSKPINAEELVKLVQAVLG